MREEAENDPKKVDRNLSRTIHVIEESFGILVGYDYSYEKLQSQIEYLQYNAHKRKVGKK